MPYNASKDIVLGNWELDDLEFSVHEYDEGTRKFQIGPRTIARPGQEAIKAKAGRLDVIEVKFLKGILPEVIKVMEKEKGKK